MELVAECANREVAQTTAETKGDWKPMVFIMTDGLPTDDWEKGLAKFQQRKWGIVVGCAINDGDTSVLQKICGEAVVKLDTADSGSIAAQFQRDSGSDLTGA